MGLGAARRLMEPSLRLVPVFQTEVRSGLDSLQIEDSMDRQAHNLTDELKRVAGRGATPQRLALMPLLLELAGAIDASYAAQGYIVLDYLKASIGRVERPITFW